MSNTTNQAEISVCMIDQQPLIVDAIVEEQDTNLLLDTRPYIQDTQESYKALVTEMNRQKPLLPGQIIIKHTLPARLIAIVYDLEQSPVCREEYVTRTLENIIDELNKYKLRSVAMPLLGNAHGKIIEKLFIKLLHDSLTCRKLSYPEKITLLCSPEIIDNIREVLKQYRDTTAFVTAR